MQKLQDLFDIQSQRRPSYKDTLEGNKNQWIERELSQDLNAVDMQHLFLNSDLNSIQKILSSKDRHPVESLLCFASRV
jgi:hypothetical protein